MLETFVEKGNKKADVSDIIVACTKAANAQGLKVADIRKTMKVYIKPEESKAYYVVGDTVGSIAIDFK